MLKMSPNWNPDDIPRDFWHTIESAQGDHQRLRALLEPLSSDALRAFYEDYQRALTALRDPQYTRPGSSEDDQEDAAGWVIGQGEALYRQVHDHPEEMPPDAPDKRGMGFASLVARIHEERFGTNLFDIVYSDG